MPANPVSSTLVSVQATYRLYQAGNGAIACDEVINIPLAYTVFKQVQMNKRAYCIIPAVEFNIAIRGVNFKIVTNEGITVEPFSTPDRLEETNPYDGQRFYFVLPRGTTGIKDVVLSHNLPITLEFGIMPPPYNYDNALFGVVSSEISYIKESIWSLTPHYGYKIPNGEHTVDFSSESTSLEIKPDTRLITFTLNNAATTDVNFNCYIVKAADTSKRSEVTLTLKPGRNIVKIDLLTHIVYVRPSTPELLVTETYSTSGIVDTVYGDIKFGYISNDKITGVVIVYEWK